MGTLQTLARELGADDRTLRRAVQQGAVRGHRPSPRRLQITGEERGYLREHWKLLAALREALRTEPTVRLAVMFGSTARGDDGPESDIDLLVSLADGASPLSALALGARLGAAVEREVGVARLERVRGESPLLLEQVIDEGRVLVDRDGIWGGQILAENERIRRRARRQYRQEAQAAREAIDDFLNEK